VTRDPFQVVRLDEIEPSTAREGWVPIRRRLGISAFGINAWSAAEGGEVIPDHDEVPTGHEELYYVLEGTATFTLDGQTAEATAGTLVLVSDPATKRSAVAGAGGATVLTVGGKPGEAFRVSAWEVNSEVFPLFDRGEYAEAKRLLAETLAEHPDAGGVLYNLACAEAQLGEREAALGHLRRALEIHPGFAEPIHSDDDLASLRDDPGFPPPAG
jgi:tetratricopeptide (TPR) repeat protein